MTAPGLKLSMEVLERNTRLASDPEAFVHQWMGSFEVEMD